MSKFVSNKLLIVGGIGVLIAGGLVTWFVLRSRSVNDQLTNPRPADVPYLVDSLKISQGNPDKQTEILAAMARLGADAGTAIPQVAALTTSDHPKEVRAQAVTTLQAIGLSPLRELMTSENFEEQTLAANALVTAFAEKSIKIFREQLASDNRQRQFVALWGLKQSGEQAEEAIPDLVKQLSAAQGDPALQRMILEALGEIRSRPNFIVPELVETAAAAQPDLRQTSLQEMAKYTDHAAELLPVLINALDDPHFQVRTQALKTIGEFGPLAGSVVPTLVSTLQARQEDEGEEEFYRELTATLGKIGAAANPFWLKTLESQDVDVRVATVQALLSIKSQAVPAIPVLIEALKDPDPNVVALSSNCLVGLKTDAIPELKTTVMTASEIKLRTQALVILQRIGPEALPAIVKGLESPESLIRVAAAEAIGRMGKEGSPAVAALVKSLDDGAISVKVAVVQALGEIGTQAGPAVPQLLPLLMETEKELQLSVLEALRKIGPAAATAIPQVTDLLRKPNSELQLAALKTLRTFEAGAASAIPVLTSLLKTAEEEVGQASARTLGAIGEAAIPPLLQVLKSDDATHRVRAGVGLGAMEPNLKTVLPALIAGLQDDSPAVRLQLLIVLESYGELGAEAEKQVEELLQDDNDQVKTQAEATLKAISMKSSETDGEPCEFPEESAE